MTADTTHVKVVLTADARPYERALQGAARSASTVERSMNKVKTTTDKAADSGDSVSESMEEIAAHTTKASLAATALGTAITFVGAKAVGFLQGAIAAASDFNETVSKMTTVFGDGADEVEKFFANSAQDFGLSKTQAYDVATNIASMGKAAGLSGAELAKFANETVALSADLASFYNAAGGAEEVIYALSSAMRGEYESARRYNILLDDMTLRQRALSMGIIQTTKLALTPQQKVLAVQAELFAQTKDAQGDFAKTSEGLANSQRTMAATMADARVELGEHLLPIMLAGVDVLTTMVDWFNGLSDGAQRAVAYLAAAAAAITLLGPPIKGLITLLTLFRAAALGASGANLGIAGTAALAATGVGALAANVYAVGLAIARILGPIALFLAALEGIDMLTEKLTGKGASNWAEKLSIPGFYTDKEGMQHGPFGMELGKVGEEEKKAAEETDKMRVEAEKLQATIQAMSDEMLAGADATGALGGAMGGLAAQVSAADQGIIDLMGTINAHIDAQQDLMATGDAILGWEDKMRASAKQTVAAKGGSGGGAAASKAEREEQQKTIDAIRKRENAEAEAEIKRARRAAQRKADRRADRQARAEAQAGVAATIAALEKAKRGEDLTPEEVEAARGTGSVGEKEGKLTKGEEKGLDAKVDAIRKKHQKTIEAATKAIRGTTDATNSAGKATEYYNFTLNKNTEAGRQNRAMFSERMNEIQARAAAVYQAALDAGAEIPEASRLAQAEFDRLIGKLEETGVSAGYARDDVHALIEEMGLTPDVIKTIFTMTLKPELDSKRMKDIRAELDSLDAKANGIGSAAQHRIKEEKDRLESELENAENQRNFSPADARRSGVNRAGGGEVYGPGGPTSDSVPLWASAGEYVVNASSYAANRDLVRAINASSGRVSGGMNVGTITVNETSGNRVRMSVIDALAESAYRSGVVR